MAVERSGQVHLFRYKSGNSIFHHCPAWIKILCVFITGGIAFLVPPPASLILSGCTLIAAKRAGFSLKEQLQDLLPVAFYASLLYVTTILTNLSETVLTPQPDFSVLSLFMPAHQDLVLCLRLILVFQFTALLFKTTTSLALREGILFVETAVRSVLPVSKKAVFAETFSFFLLFIPRILDIWNSIDCAWKARKGKNGIRKIRILIPILISLCMHSAWKTDLASRSRQS